MKIINIEIKNLKDKPYSITTTEFEIGNKQFVFNSLVFGKTKEECLPKIKKEIGNYLLKQLFTEYEALDKLDK